MCGRVWLTQASRGTPACASLPLVVHPLARRVWADGHTRFTVDTVRTARVVDHSSLYQSLIPTP